MNKIFVILFLSICNVVWFNNYTLGNLKMIIMACILVSHIQLFINRSNIKHFLLFLTLFITILLSIYIHPFGDLYSRSYYLYGFIENYIFYLLGAYYYKSGKLNMFFFQSLLYVVTPLCAIILFNFMFNMPDWHSISEIQRYEAMYENGYMGNDSLSPLYSTGFGVARTGWANTLCQFIPISLLLNKSLFKKISIVLLLTSVFLTGSRGGIICALVIISIYTYNITPRLSSKIIFMSFSIICCVIVALFWDQISVYLRLTDPTDMTSGRIDQYFLIPVLVSSMSIWGLGINEIGKLFSRYGIFTTLHNTYAQLSIENGLFFTLIFIILLYYIIRILIYTSKTKDQYISALRLVVISGLISGLFEPKAVFGAVNWYSIWWFSLGILSQFRIENSTYDVVAPADKKY